MLATAPTPEDESFWQRVGEKGACGHILSDSFVTARRRRGGAGRSPGQPDRAGAGQRALRRRPRRPQRAAARRGGRRGQPAELAATLESVADGVLVVDLAGHISNFNRRFAALWELPDEMLLLRADDEMFDWMRQRVADPAAYMRRLAEIDDQTMLRATDTLTPALGRRARAGDAAAAEPRPADRPRLLVPGRRRRRVLSPAAASAPLAPGPGVRIALIAVTAAARDLATVGAFTTNSERQPCPRSPVSSSSASGP